MARIVQQGVITTSGTSYENEPIIKSDGASGEVMQWLASTGSSKVTIDEDSSNVQYPPHRSFIFAYEHDKL